jgi:hypothetical protein
VREQVPYRGGLGGLESLWADCGPACVRGIETLWGMDVSGAVNAAPLWGREIQVWLEVKLSTREPFDDQHGAGAGGTTRQVRCFGEICACHCAEQLAATCEGGFPSSVGEQTEVTDADQPFGQNVKKKSAQELIC